MLDLSRKFAGRIDRSIDVEPVSLADRKIVCTVPSVSIVSVVVID